MFCLLKLHFVLHSLQNILRTVVLKKIGTFVYSTSGRSYAAHPGLFSVNTGDSVTRSKAERRKVESLLQSRNQVKNERSFTSNPYIYFQYLNDEHLSDTPRTCNACKASGGAFGRRLSFKQRDKKHPIPACIMLINSLGYIVVVERLYMKHK